MVGWRSSTLVVFAIGSVGAVAPEHDLRRNVYLSLDDCRGDYAARGCLSEQAQIVGPWYAIDSAHALAADPGAGASAIAGASQRAVAAQTKRGGFGGTAKAWSCSPNGGGGGGR